MCVLTKGFQFMVFFNKCKIFFLYIKKNGDFVAIKIVKIFENFDFGV